jgi:BatD DUF11 like domain
MTYRSAAKSIFALAIILAWTSAHAAVHASLDSANIAADGTVQLTLEHDGSTSDEPDLSPLSQNFDVLSRSSGSTMQIINGNVSSHVRWRLLLSPKHSGDLAIPPISWGGEQSEALTLHVGGSAPNAQTSKSRTVFVESKAEPERPYVQAEVDLTVRIYSQVPLYHASLDLPASDGVLVQQMGADRTETEVRDGERYQVIERRYALFPQHSGPLTLPGPVLDAQIAVRDGNSSLGDQFKDLFGNMMPLNNLLTTLKPISEHGDDLSLDVLPRPTGTVGDYWLPAREVKLDAEWHPASSSQVKAGDPVTVDLHLKAQGLTAAQLPDLSTLLQLPPGLRTYPDQAKLANDTHGDVLVGTRDQSVALIADQPGQFKVPALTIHWWDSSSNQPREATLPERILTVLPAAASVSPQRAPAASAPAPVGSPARGANEATKVLQSGAAGPGEYLWRWVSLALGSLWIVTLIAWYVTRRRAPPTSAEGIHVMTEGRRLSLAEARREFHEACRRNDARAARAALIRWIRTAQPDRGSLGLRAFALETKDDQLGGLLIDLDRACYAGASWSGAQLLAALQDLPLRFPDEPAARQALAPLYR